MAVELFEMSNRNGAKGCGLGVLSCILVMWALSALIPRPLEVISLNTQHKDRLSVVCRSGAKVWFTNLDSRGKISEKQDIFVKPGERLAPLATVDSLYLLRDGNIEALEQTSGKSKWKTALPAPTDLTDSSAQMGIFDDKKQTIVSFPAKGGPIVACFEKESGKMLWFRQEKVESAKDGGAVGIRLLTCKDDYLSYLSGRSLRVLNRSTGNDAAGFAQLSEAGPAQVWVGNKLYFENKGQLLCFDGYVKPTGYQMTAKRLPVVALGESQGKILIAYAYQGSPDSGGSYRYRDYSEEGDSTQGGYLELYNPSSQKQEWLLSLRGMRVTECQRGMEGTLRAELPTKLVLTTNDGRLFGVDLSRGELLWFSKPMKKVDFEPWILYHDKNVTYISDFFIATITAQDGTVEWAVRSPVRAEAPDKKSALLGIFENQIWSLASGPVSLPWNGKYPVKVLKIGDPPNQDWPDASESLSNELDISTP